MTISRGQMYRQLYYAGGKGIASLDAGAPSIKYEGNINPQMASNYVGGPAGPLSLRDKYSIAIIGKPYKELSFEEQQMIDQILKTPESRLPSQEPDLSREQKLMASAPDPLADLNDIALNIFGRPLQQLTEDERDLLQDIARDSMNKGGIARQKYGLGSLVKKAFKGVKDVVKSDIGKAALGAAGLYYLGGGALGPLQRAGMSGFSFGNIPGVLQARQLFQGTPMGEYDPRSGGVLSKFFKSDLGKTAAVGLGGAALSLLSQSGLSDEEIQGLQRDPEALAGYLRSSYKRVNPDASEQEVETFVAENTREYRAGGGITRVNLKFGSPIGGLLNLAKKFGKDVVRKGRNYLDRITDDVEIETFADYADDSGASLDIVLKPKTKKGKKALEELAEEGILDPKDQFGKYYVREADDFIGGAIEKDIKASGIIDNEGKFIRFDEGAGMSDYVDITGENVPYYGFDPLIEAFVRSKKFEGGRVNYEAGGMKKRSILERLVEKLGGPDLLKAELGLSGLLELYNVLGMPLMADGGRIMTPEEYFKEKSKRNELGTYEEMRREYEDYLYRQKYGPRNSAAKGGIMDVPVRKNQAGVKELDYREKGGFVPPIGLKEKEDDIPAMLSNNEFVFTADAVRGAGDGNVDKGAKKMYMLMKTLEKGGKV